MGIVFLYVPKGFAERFAIPEGMDMWDDNYIRDEWSGEERECCNEF